MPDTEIAKFFHIPYSTWNDWKADEKRSKRIKAMKKAYKAHMWYSKQMQEIRQAAGEID